MPPLTLTTSKEKSTIIIPICLHRSTQKVNLPWGHRRDWSSCFRWKPRRVLDRRDVRRRYVQRYSFHCWLCRQVSPEVLTGKVISFLYTRLNTSVSGTECYSPLKRSRVRRPMEAFVPPTVVGDRLSPSPHLTYPLCF